MPDKTFVTVLPPLKAIDNGDGTFSVSIELPDTSAVWSYLEDLAVFIHHESFYFPEDTNETITFVAGALDNEFGEWVEIEDNNSITFSSKLVDNPAHLSAIVVEEADTKEKRYLVEIACGPEKTIIGRLRFWQGDKFIGTIQAVSLRPPIIPQGCTAYYRMKCETGGAEAVIHLRYHKH